MEVFDAVRTLLAVREFQDKPVPPDAAHRIVEAARLSGSAANRQPWHFFAVADASRAIQSMVVTAWSKACPEWARAMGEDTKGHRLELGRLRRARRRQAHPRPPRQPRRARDRPLRLPGEACRPGQEAAQAVRAGREPEPVRGAVRIDVTPVRATCATS